MKFKLAPIVAILCTIWAIYLILFLLTRPPSKPVFKDVSSPKTYAWSVWYFEHSKTCKQCSRNDEAMCEEAFDKLQESLRK